MNVFPGALVMPANERHNQTAVQVRLEIKAKEAKARQVTKIRALGDALTASGLFKLDEQTRALGLSRSSAWAILQANHKASGLTAATINRMLSSPELPPIARTTILTYVEEKLAGLYGHNKEQLSRFKAALLRQSRSLAPQLAARCSLSNQLLILTPGYGQSSP